MRPKILQVPTPTAVPACLLSTKRIKLNNDMYTCIFKPMIETL